MSRLLDLKLRNQQIAETAASLIKAEKKIAQLNMKDREEENFKTAFLLHEEIAQIAAAIKLYVNTAKNTKELSDEFLDQSISELTNLTKSITGLSKSITPTTFEGDDYIGYIEKMVQDFKQENDIPVAFGSEGDVACLKGHFGLMVFRVVQDLLKLTKYVNAEAVRLDVQCGHAIQLLCTYTAKKQNLVSDKHMLETNILNRVEMLEGRMELRDAVGTEHPSLIRVELPVK